ncbi:MAG TPA: LysE family transporter [Anaerolineae bacterium]|nr:LysE family transporter [Anaerolineae bacterium]HMR67718.1 LysE family transporter [Anaerolineae bacterium]
MLLYLLQGLGYGFAAAVQPGPFQTYLISQTLVKGWRSTLPAIFAPLVTDGPIIALVLLVLSQVPVWFERFLYLASGLFILYLAYGALKRWQTFDPTAAVAATPNRQTLWQAALMNLISPGPYIFWSLVTGPILLTGWRAAPLNGLGLLGGFYGAMLLSLSGIILVFGTARQLGPRVNRALLGVSALALAGFGLYQLWLGLSYG